MKMVRFAQECSGRNAHRPVFEFQQQPAPETQARCSEDTYPQGKIHSDISEWFGRKKERISTCYGSPQATITLYRRQKQTPLFFQVYLISVQPKTFTSPTLTSRLAIAVYNCTITKFTSKIKNVYVLEASPSSRRTKDAPSPGAVRGRPELYCTRSTWSTWVTQGIKTPNK